MDRNWDSVEVQRLRPLPVKGAQVRSLLGELRAHTHCGMTKKTTHTQRIGRHQVDLSISVCCVHTCVHAHVHGCSVFTCSGVCTDTHKESLFHKEGTRVELLPGARTGGRTAWEFAVDVYALCARGRPAGPTVRTGPLPSVTRQPGLGGFVGEGTHGCAWLRPCAVRLKLCRRC